MGFEELLPMAVRGVFYTHPMYSPQHQWHKDKQGWVSLQEKRPMSCLPGHVPKELRCLLASMAGSVLWLWIGFPLCHPKLYEDHHGTTGQTYLNSIAFQPQNHKLKIEMRMNQSAHSHTFTPEVITVFPSPSPFGEVPDLQNSSQRFLGVDWTPLPPSGTGPDWGLTFSLGGLPSSDEIARQVCPLLFGVQLGKDYSEGWNSGEKENREYHWVACRLICSQVPPYSVAAQPLASGSRGQSGWNLSGASRNVTEILSYRKPRDIQRSRRTQTLFDAGGPRWAYTQNSGPRAVKLQDF
jgi:hypothetical protein